MPPHDRLAPHAAAESALDGWRVEDAHLERLMQASLVGVILTEGDRIVEANDNFLRTVGYTRDDLAAGNIQWLGMTPPEYVPLNDQALAALNERGACAPFEKEYYRKDG